MREQTPKRLASGSPKATTDSDDDDVGNDQKESTKVLYGRLTKIHNLVFHETSEQLPFPFGELAQLFQ